MFNVYLKNARFLNVLISSHLRSEIQELYSNSIQELYSKSKVEFLYYLFSDFPDFMNTNSYVQQVKHNLLLDIFNS